MNRALALDPSPLLIVPGGGHKQKNDFLVKRPLVFVLVSISDERVSILYAINEKQKKQTNKKAPLYT